ncbi:MAG: ATP-binding protein, partial [Bacteroidales bacterium]|nr:ATP-binding protein [Bacteroidales bacterium]
MKKPSTPFPTTGYYGPEYFCDRTRELESLTRNIRGGTSTTLVALRRMGKTALIRHLQYEMKNDHMGVYVDILPTESMLDLLNSLATGIAAMVPEKSPPGAKVWKFLKSLRPVVSYDALSGMPTLSFNQGAEEGLKSIGELFEFLEQQKYPVILAIDEFQQILSYQEKHMDALLRSKIQELKNVRFVFSGSQQHLINEIFADPSRPFYRSTQFLKLGKIGREAYHPFIANKFRDHSKNIADNTIESVLDWTEGYTYYVQLLCNRIFLSSGRQVHPELWKEEALRLLKEQEFVFYSYREGLTSNQWGLLKAVAREGMVREPTSGAFISRHQLGSSATVLRALATLQKKELVYR